MTYGELLVLKLGGSVATVKDRGLTARLSLLARYASIVSRLVGEGRRVLLVLGGGSYGHYAVSECRRMGLGPAACLSRVASAMGKLAGVVSELLAAEGIAPLAYPPHGLCDPAGLKPRCSWRLVGRALEAGATPIVYGDVYPVPGGYVIVSGDELAVEAACQLRAARLVYATSVDGVYRGDSLVERVEGRGALAGLLGYAGGGGGYDVTGGMARKLKALLVNGCRGLEAWIVNGFHPDRVEEALRGGRPIGTVVYL